MYHGRIVETGRTSDVLAWPAHPYTAALLRSVPQCETLLDDGQSTELTVIPGSPPPPGQQLPGCAFAPRCSWAIERCVSERPELEVAGPGRLAACHRLEEVLSERH